MKDGIQRRSFISGIVALVAGLFGGKAALSAEKSWWMGIDKATLKDVSYTTSANEVLTFSDSVYIETSTDGKNWKPSKKLLQQQGEQMRQLMQRLPGITVNQFENMTLEQMQNLSAVIEAAMVHKLKRRRG